MGYDHAISRLILSARLKFIDTLLLHAKTQRRFVSPKHHQILSQVVKHIKLHFLKLLNIHILQTLVVREVPPIEVLVTNLALDHHLWALALDMLEKLGTGHVLEIFMVTNVTAKLRAIIHRVLLKLLHRFPNDFSVFVLFPVLEAPMWELTEIDAVLQDLVDSLQEVSLLTTVRATHSILT